MTCVSPPELADKDLLLYLDGEAEEEVVAHLEQCPHCRERTDRLARLEGLLTTQLYRIDCPPPAELGEYHLGMLPRNRAAAVTQHLDKCPHCSREIAQLKDYLGTLTPGLETGPFERIKVLVARLVAEARDMARPTQMLPAPAYAGLRGEEEGPTLYQAGDVQIVIEVQDDAEQQDRRVLLALVSGMDTAELEAHLWQADQLLTTVPVDDLGNLIIPGLAPGDYELILSGPDTEIHLQSLEI